MKQNYFLGEISIGFLLFFAKMSKSIYNSKKKKKKKKYSERNLSVVRLCRLCMASPIASSIHNI